MSGWATQIRRVKEGLRQAVGISQSVDDEYFDEQIRLWESKVQDLRKAKDTIELYLDSLAISSMAGIALADSITRLGYHPRNSERDKSINGPETRDFTSLFSQINSDINNTLHSSFRTAIVNRCLKPLTELLTSVSLTYEKINRRKDILLDFNAYSNKAYRESRANNPHLNRTAHKLEDVTKELANLQADILNSVNELDDAISETLLTEISCVCGSLYYYHSASAMLLGQMLPSLPPSGAASLSLLSMAANAAHQLNSPLLAHQLRTYQAAQSSSSQLQQQDEASWDEMNKVLHTSNRPADRRSGQKLSGNRELNAVMSTLQAFESSGADETLVENENENDDDNEDDDAIQESASNSRVQSPATTLAQASLQHPHPLPAKPPKPSSKTTTAGAGAGGEKPHKPEKPPKASSKQHSDNNSDSPDEAAHEAAAAPSMSDSNVDCCSPSSELDAYIDQSSVPPSFHPQQSHQYDGDIGTAAEQLEKGEDDGDDAHVSSLPQNNENVDEGQRVDGATSSSSSTAAATCNTATEFSPTSTATSAIDGVDAAGEVVDAHSNGKVDGTGAGGGNGDGSAAAVAGTAETEYEC